MATEKCIRWSNTIVLLFVMLNAGFILGMLSPTLPDLQHLTKSSTAAISTLFIWTGITGIIGAILIGPLFDRFDWSFIMTLTVFLQGVFVGLVPWCPNLVGVSIMLSLVAAVNFGIMTGGFSAVMKLWTHDPRWAGPMVQAADLAHALGSALVPQFVAPFLTDYRNITVTNHTTVATPVDPVHASVFAENYPVQNETDIKDSKNRVGYAYVLIGGLSVVMSIACLVTYISMRNNGKQESIHEKKDDSIVDDEHSISASMNSFKGTKSYKCHYAVFMVSTIISFWSSGGRDVLMTGLLYTYVTTFLQWSVDEGTLLVTVYHVIRVVIHVFVVVAARWTRPIIIYILDIMILILAPLIMIFTVESSKISVWLCVCLIGFGSSNINPTLLSVTQETIPASGKAIGFCVAGIALGQATFSPISGILLQKNGAVSFPAVLLGVACASLLLMIPLLLTARQINKTKDRAVFAKFHAQDVLGDENNLKAGEKAPLLEGD